MNFPRDDHFDSISFRIYANLSLLVTLDLHVHVMFQLSRLTHRFSIPSFFIGISPLVVNFLDYRDMTDRSVGSRVTDNNGCIPKILERTRASLIDFRNNQNHAISQRNFNEGSNEKWSLRIGLENQIGQVARRKNSRRDTQALRVSRGDRENVAKIIPECVLVARFISVSTESSLKSRGETGSSGGERPRRDANKVVLFARAREPGNLQSRRNNVCESHIKVSILEIAY